MIFSKQNFYKLKTYGSSFVPEPDVILIFELRYVTGTTSISVLETDPRA